MLGVLEGKKQNINKANMKFNIAWQKVKENVWKTFLKIQGEVIQ